MKEILDFFKSMVKDSHDNTINGHYGIKKEDYVLIEKQMLCDVIMCNKYSDVIDKHFSKLSQEERAKVFAFANAIRTFKDMEGK